jgi:hypothetical protein
MKERKKERIFLNHSTIGITRFIANIVHSKSVACIKEKKIHHRTIYRQDWVERDYWDRNKNPESHPGAPCSLPHSYRRQFSFLDLEDDPGPGQLTLFHT